MQAGTHKCTHGDFFLNRRSKKKVTSRPAKGGEEEEEKLFQTSGLGTRSVSGRAATHGQVIELSFPPQRMEINPKEKNGIYFLPT